MLGLIVKNKFLETCWADMRARTQRVCVRTSKSIGKFSLLPHTLIVIWAVSTLMSFNGEIPFSCLKGNIFRR